MLEFPYLKRDGRPAYSCTYLKVFRDKKAHSPNGYSYDSSNRAVSKKKSNRSCHPFAPIALKASGVKLVIAKSFARIFYRAAINQGLLLIESDQAVRACNPDSTVRIDAENGLIFVDTQSFRFPALPDEIKKISRAGGLLAYTRNLLEND
jgi:hypothetical protein